MWFIRREMRRHRSRQLSVPQFRTLVLVDQYPDASLSCVAEHLGTSLPTASRLVSRLVSKKFVARREGEGDRRLIRLQLTAAGREALEAARKQTQRSLENAIAGLTAAQRTQVVDVMKLIRETFAVAAGPGNHGKPTMKPTAAPGRRAAAAAAGLGVGR